MQRQPLVSIQHPELNTCTVNCPPINPSRASISRTNWPLPSPPIAGLPRTSRQFLLPSLSDQSCFGPHTGCRGLRCLCACMAAAVHHNIIFLRRHYDSFHDYIWKKRHSQPFTGLTSPLIVLARLMATNYSVSVKHQSSIRFAPPASGMVARYLPIQKEEKM